jgi:stage II sporulation protein D
MLKQRSFRLGLSVAVVFVLLYPSSFSAFASLEKLQVKNAKSSPDSGSNKIQSSSSSSKEPVVRVGLATDATSANISTVQGSLIASFDSSTEKTIGTPRLRFEVRRASGASGDSFIANTRSVPTGTPRNQHSAALVQETPRRNDGRSVEVTGLRTKDEAEIAAGDIAKLTRESTQVSQADDRSGWRIYVGRSLPIEQANRLSSLLGEQGFLVEVVAAQSHSPVRNLSDENSADAVTPARQQLVRTVSRVTSSVHETVAFDSVSTRMFSSKGTVVLSPGDEGSVVKFNDKPYRGQIEVFANARGALTVVNVVGLEDYVRGVVANELSPEVFPELEALKAQAVAARTYAIRHRDQFATQGFDVLPTTRSQVYDGISTERPLSDRAVKETRGQIATFDGKPIDAVYTSTCGGRTEDAEEIFESAASPYLRGRECSVEGPSPLSVFTVKTTRPSFDIRDERNSFLARDAALLDVNGFELSKKLNDAWLLAMPSSSEVREWLAMASKLAHQKESGSSDELTRAPGFATALTLAVFGERRGDTLLDNADVEYLLGFRDGNEVPQRNRADVALLVREGVLTLYPDATLRPREAMSRGRILHAISKLLEKHGFLRTQKSVARPSVNGSLVLKSAKNRDETITLAPNLFLLRAMGDAVFQVRQLPIVGGEPVLYHQKRQGEVDFLEVSPTPNGAASDHSSNYSNWNATLVVSEVQSRLSRSMQGIGSIKDLKVSRRGSSRRVTELEIIGTEGTAHIRGGRIRSVLGLKDQLFVIDRQFDTDGKVTSFTFTGRGFGHGVGMCQVGAFGLAQAGYSYQEILKAYYTGIELSTLY